MSTPERIATVAPVSPGVDRSAPVAVVTDSVATVPAEVASALAIAVVPFSIIVGERVYADGTDLTPTELYRAMRQQHVMPSTAQPPIMTYVEAFRACLRRGASAVVYVGVSSKLTSALSAARVAAELVREELPQSQIVLVDSRAAASAQGFIVEEAAQAAMRGATAAEVCARIDVARQHVRLVATIGSLEYLARGGHVGHLGAFMGGLLDIKPIITLDAEGAVIPLARARGMSAALDYLVEWAATHTAGSRQIRVAVLHAGSPDLARRIERRASAALHPRQIFTVELTPVMGAHTGPGVAGLAYFAE